MEIGSRRFSFKQKFVQKVKTKAEWGIVHIPQTSVIYEWMLCAQLSCILVTWMNKAYSVFKKKFKYESVCARRMWLVRLFCCHLTYPLQICGGNLRDRLEIWTMSPNPEDEKRRMRNSASSPSSVLLSVVCEWWWCPDMYCHLTN